MSETAVPVPRPARGEPEKAQDPLFGLGKALNDIRLPGIDLQALAASHHRNIEALTRAGQLAADRVRALAEMIQQSIEQTSAMLRTWSQPGAPEDRLANQAELAKSVFETGIANARELADLVAKAGTDIFELLKTRATESLDEGCKLLSRRGSVWGDAASGHGDH